MKYRDVEAMLYNYKFLKASIKNDKLKLENIDIEFEYEDGLKSTTVGDGIRSCEISNPTENSAIENIEKKLQLKREIEKKTRLEENKIKMLENAFEILSELEKSIITYFYIENMEWWKVAEKVAYSEGWCKEKRKEAVTKLTKLLKMQ